MAHAQLYQGTWEQIATVARTHRGRTNLTLIVPLDEETNTTFQPIASPADVENETARTAAIRAGRGSLASGISLVDELHQERQRDKMQEEQEIAQWFTPSTPDR